MRSLISTQKRRTSYKRDRTIRINELVATLKELCKNECNIGTLDDPVLTGFSDEDSEKSGDGVVIEGSD